MEVIGRAVLEADVRGRGVGRGFSEAEEAVAGAAETAGEEVLERRDGRNGRRRRV